jgi:uncharacterized protein YbjT (DUF2867 family)
MIVICGATGKIGGTAARALRKRGVPVTAVVRDPEKARALEAQGCTLARADLGDEGALTAAFRGAEAVLVLCPLAATDEQVEAHSQRIIEVVGAAIEAARPRRVVAISDYGVHVPSGTGVTMILRRVEDRLRAVPAGATRMTFVRSAEHMQNWVRQLRVVRSRGVLPSLHHPVARAFPTVSALDVGLVAAELLEAGSDASTADSAGDAPRVVHVEGPRRYSAADIAATYAELLARDVTALELARDEWSGALKAGGLSDAYARLVMELQDAHNAGRIDAEPGGEVRRGDTTLEAALAAAAAIA